MKSVASAKVKLNAILSPVPAAIPFVRIGSRPGWPTTSRAKVGCGPSDGLQVVEYRPVTVSVAVIVAAASVILSVVVDAAGVRVIVIAGAVTETV